MPSTPRETFLSLPDEVLQGLAQAHGVDPTRYPNRASLIEALASLPGAEDLVPEASRRRMAYQLDRLRPRQLRELGERHRVVLHGLKRKADLVEALAGAPDSSEILMELEAEAAPERDATLALGRESDVDFDRVEELLEQARKSFQERRFEAALTAAQEASRLAARVLSSRPIGREMHGAAGSVRSRSRSVPSRTTSKSLATSALTSGRRRNSTKPRRPRLPRANTAVPGTS